MKCIIYIILLGASNRKTVTIALSYCFTLIKWGLYRIIRYKPRIDTNLPWLGAAATATSPTPPYLASQSAVRRMPVSRCLSADALRQKQWGPTKSHGLQRRSIQTNIIKVHHARTSSNRIIPVAQTNSNSIDIGQVHALVCECL